MFEPLLEYNEKKLIAIISITFLIFRLSFLTVLPIFNDEAIYLDWGQRMIAGQLPMFYSLFDGKQPLLMWTFGIIAYPTSNPLAAGRFVSVIAGLLTVIGLYKLGKLIANKKIAFYSVLFYIFTPIFIFYDRQALMEASVAAAGIWIIVFTLLYLHNKKYKYIFYAGLTLGVSLFIKSSVLLFLIPLIMILVWSKVKNKLTANELFKFSLVIVFTALVLLLPLIFQKDFGKFISSGSRFSLSFNEIMGIGVTDWLVRIRRTAEILFWQVNPVIFLISVYALYLLLRKKDWDIQKFVLLSLLAPTITAFITMPSIQPRYLEPYLWVFPVLVAYAIEDSNRYGKSLKYAIIVLLASVAFIITIKPNYYLIFLNKVSNASDYRGYMGGFTSGYGFNEAKNLIEEKSKDGPVLVGVRLDAGIPESAVFAYWAIGRNPNIKPIYFDSSVVNVDPSAQIINLPAPMYYVAREHQLGGLEKYFEEVEKFYKPDGKSFIGVYKLKTNNSQPSTNN